MIPIKWTLHQFISPFIEIISGGYGQLAALKTYNRDLKKRLGHSKGQFWVKIWELLLYMYNQSVAIFNIFWLFFRWLRPIRGFENLQS